MIVLKTMNDLPIITIAILVYNAKDQFEKMFANLKKIKYPLKKLEIIVVDNSAKDEISSFIKKILPATKYIKLKKNLGISGWNFAFKKMRGELCLVLDHDSYIEPNGLNKAVKYFRKKNIGIVACNIINPFSKKPELKYFNKKGTTYSYDFIGGGVFIGKNVFKKIGYFDEDIFIYGHETEFSLRALNKGLKILFAPDIYIYRTVEENKPNELRIKFALRNLLSVYWKYLSFRNALSCSLAFIIESFYLSVLSGNILAFFKGFAMFTRKMRKIFIERKIIRKTIENDWINIYPFTLRNLFLRAVRIYKI